MTDQERTQRLQQIRQQHEARKRRVSAAMADLLGEQAKQSRLQEVRHQNERAELVEQHEREILALAEKEKPAEK